MVATFFDAASSLDSAARLAQLRKFARLLDAQFALPGTDFRFGIDAIIGLWPGAGDAIMGVVSLWIVNEARQMGAPNALLGRMLANVAVEVVAGSIPLVGDLFDAAFKANLRNVQLLENWIAGR